jgi:hypothetical protein
MSGKLQERATNESPVDLDAQTVHHNSYEPVHDINNKNVNQEQQVVYEKDPEEAPPAYDTTIKFSPSDPTPKRQQNQPVDNVIQSKLVFCYRNKTLLFFFKILHQIIKEDLSLLVIYGHVLRLVLYVHIVVQQVLHMSKHPVLLLLLCSQLFYSSSVFVFLSSHFVFQLVKKLHITVLAAMLY